MLENIEIEEKLSCYHCGENCPDNNNAIEDKVFCCIGCKTVFEILNENNLCKYYTFEQSPGNSFRDFQNKRYEYLDDEKIINQLLDYQNNNLGIITFYIPQMHCSSCIWLLENLFKINNGIKNSEVNFLKKELMVRFNINEIKLRELVQLLVSIGYEPEINLESIEKKSENTQNKKLYYKIGIAAFCFGNIMLLSFPEYLSINISSDEYLKRFFSYLIFFFSLPVFLYSSSDYFISAYKGLRKKIINLDFPLSLGILVLFLRSTYEIITNGNPGYFDSMAGLIFFLLLGKLFQNKTYESLNFERNYKAYFPLSVTVKKNNQEISIPVSKLEVGDRIIIRNNEIIPADSILFSPSGNIDYSFVTGESKPVTKLTGELIYAGGKQIGELLELEVIKEVSQSYLTKLWNNELFNKKDKSDFVTLSNAVSKYFTFAVLLIGFIAAAFWLNSGLGEALNILTAVLIVSCPCALALSTPFTLGNTLRIFGRNKFYLKNILTIEEMAKVNEIVFDKTGTLTKTNSSEVNFIGDDIDEAQKEMVKTVVKNSNHPLSRKILNYLDKKSGKNNSELQNVLEDFEEISGKGIKGVISENEIKIGSADFMNDQSTFLNEQSENFGTKVYLAFNKKVKGFFNFSNEYRDGIKKIILELKNKYSVSLLSGDNQGEKEKLIEFFGEDSQILFKQSPHDKLEHIKYLQQKNKKVLMIGDGLNDAGALAQSNIGVAVTEDTTSFSPACDAILDADEINKIPMFLKFSKTSVKIILISFGISFAYNIVGLSFAVMGFLSPLIAAVLMPVSSISVVVFATVATNLVARKRGLLSQQL
ncbi:MAG TPA: heavy metal translocating P-type ATPase metal-binding domain-containing protein [Ignavibacteriaceae bacterium]|nr:heavy metal translocating P-type ATPase metal-binding domain-containing protein [Ignavibacteriaceae bacterium]